MGCIKLHILDEQYKSTELKVSYINKKLTSKNSAVNPCRCAVIMRIDPNGMDDIPVDENGNFKRDQNGNLQIIKTDQPHRLAVDTKGADGTMTQKYYTLADQENDYNDIKNGTINKVVSVSDKQIKGMLEQSGAFNISSKLNPISYLNQESKGKGNLDFAYSVIPNVFGEQGATQNPNSDWNKSPVLFIPQGDGNAYNQMNFGNFMWGAAGASLGADLFTLKAAAHYNSLFNSSTNGYKSQFDSRDDQFSIGRGFNYAKSRNYFWNFKFR